MQMTFGAACELKRKLHIALFALLLVMAPAVRPVLAQEHAAAAQGEHATQEHAAQAEHATEGEHHDQSIGGMIKGMAWPVANFIVFVGVLYHFFNKPLADYLAGRSATIRKDLVEAAELKSAATAQLAQIEQKLQALPGEISALRTRVFVILRQHQLFIDVS